MSNHPNRNWRRRWTIDLTARTATHTDGWVFVFADPDADGGMDGTCRVQADITGLTGDELLRTATRIAREAGEAYAQARQDAL